MKWQLFIIAIIKLGLPCYSQTDTISKKDAQPGFRFDTATWNFGTILRHERVKHTFKLINTGNVSLKINSVTGSGGGALPHYPAKNYILPGDTVDIDVHFLASTPGLFIKTIAVSTNAGQKYINIKGEVIENHSPQIQFFETEWNFGNIPQNKSVKHSFYFINVGKSPLIINDIKGSGGGQIADKWTQEPVFPGDTGEVRIAYGAFNVGLFVKSMTVKSNGDEQTLIVKGTVIRGTESSSPVVNPDK